MGVSCGAAAISIYNCGRQSDRRTAVCQGQRSRFKVIALLVTISGFILFLCSRLIHRLQQRDANVLCSVIAILRTPRVAFCEQTFLYTSAKFYELLDEFCHCDTQVWYSASAQILITITRFFWIRSTLFIINFVCYKIIIIQLSWHYIDFFWTQTWISLNCRSTRVRITLLITSWISTFL